jgi:hypothetical protein
MSKLTDTQMVLLKDCQVYMRMQDEFAGLDKIVCDSLSNVWKEYVVDELGNDWVCGEKDEDVDFADFYENSILQIMNKKWAIRNEKSIKEEPCYLTCISFERSQLWDSDKEDDYDGWLPFFVGYVDECRMAIRYYFSRLINVNAIGDREQLVEAGSLLFNKLQKEGFKISPPRRKSELYFEKAILIDPQVLIESCRVEDIEGAFEPIRKELYLFKELSPLIGDLVEKGKKVTNPT